MRLTFLLAMLSSAPPLAADPFGSGDNQITIAFVDITGGLVPDDEYSSPDLPFTPGAVPYDYRMGKFEVSRAMVDAYNAENGGPAITMEDMSSIGGNGPDRPATGITWNEAARFVNWLNVSTGNIPAYKFTTGGANDNIALWVEGDDGYQPENPFRNSKALYFLPSDDEWYRAAYYDPAAGVYWNYATGSDEAPSAVASGTTPGTAVYKKPLFDGPADVMNAGGLSPFGTMGQGGNAGEWTETAEVPPNNAPAGDRLWRASVYYAGEFSLRAGAGVQGEATTMGNFIFGFRVASKAVSKPPLSITSFTAIGGGLFEVSLTGAGSTAYQFRSSPTLDFTPGALVDNLTQGDLDDPGSTDGSKVTTDSSGAATVRMTMSGLTNFIRAQETD